MAKTKKSKEYVPKVGCKIRVTMCGESCMFVVSRIIKKSGRIRVILGEKRRELRKEDERWNIYYNGVKSGEVTVKPV